MTFSVAGHTAAGIMALQPITASTLAPPLRLVHYSTLRHEVCLLWFGPRLTTTIRKKKSIASFSSCEIFDAYRRPLLGCEAAR